MVTSEIRLVQYVVSSRWNAPQGWHRYEQETFNSQASFQVFLPREFANILHEPDQALKIRDGIFTELSRLIEMVRR